MKEIRGLTVVILQPNEEEKVVTKKDVVKKQLLYEYTENISISCALNSTNLLNFVSKEARASFGEYAECDDYLELMVMEVMVCNSKTSIQLANLGTSNAKVYGPFFIVYTEQLIDAIIKSKSKFLYLKLSLNVALIKVSIANEELDRKAGRVHDLGLKINARTAVVAENIIKSLHGEDKEPANGLCGISKYGTNSSDSDN